jgi:hypothetical protein
VCLATNVRIAVKRKYRPLAEKDTGKQKWFQVTFEFSSLPCRHARHETWRSRRNLEPSPSVYSSLLLRASLNEQTMNSTKV